MYYVYALKNRFNKIYIGYSGNLNNRLKEHNSGSVRSTKSGRPWQIAYTEEYREEEFAQKREKYLKSCVGRIKIRSILSALSK
jgi:putative endonuclease